MSDGAFLRAIAIAAVCAVTLLVGSAAAARKTLPAKPIDLNAATVEQLEQLPGVGLSTAKAIVRFREKSGRFQRVEDLLAVHGISQNKLEVLKPYVRVNLKSTAPGK